MSFVFFIIVFLSYLLSFIFYFLNFEGRSEFLSVWARRIISLGLFIHFALLVFIALRTAGPFNVQASEDMMVIPFLILVFSYFMEWRYKTRFLILFSLPPVLLFFLLGLILFQRGQGADMPVTTPWLWLHIGLIFSGLACLVTSMSTAAMYLIQSSQLKSKNPGKVFVKLPALGTLDKVHFLSLSWGVILFSFGILTGILWAKNLKALDQAIQDPKVILSFFTCVMYSGILAFRLSSLRRGHKIVMGTILIFALLFLTVISSYFTPSGFHKGF